MREFFRGWKRKLGVLTLLLACLFMAGRFRSFVGTDYIDLYTSSIEKQEGMSNLGSLRWERSEEPRNPTSPEKQWRLKWSYIPFAPPSAGDGIWIVRSGDEKPIESIWECCGIEIGEYQLKTASGTVRRNYWKMNYLWFILPLTALSTYLLLSKARRTPAKAPT